MRLTRTAKDRTTNNRETPDDTPEFLTPAEVIQKLRCGRTAGYAFAREHGIRIGRLLRVPREALRG